MKDFKSPNNTKRKRKKVEREICFECAVVMYTLRAHLKDIFRVCCFMLAYDKFKEFMLLFERMSHMCRDIHVQITVRRVKGAYAQVNHLHSLTIKNSKG